ncbi:hypothetical protein DU505_08875 [Billgrantia montanilacus]|uniref:Uncharacterized protein n=2 Tax=Billgrantia montanilacus TaxID=2282305 RepID=A0A368TZD8_9GAMM|nr:hypothetical protein DU505_08875 [Halomonas montanilacus]
MRFFQGINEEVVKGRLEEVLGSKPNKVAFHNRLEAFEVEYDASVLTNLYYQNRYKMVSSYLVSDNNLSFAKRLKVFSGLLVRKKAKDKDLP